MTDTTSIQETKVLWDTTADKLYVWDGASKAWELFFVAADLVTNDALTAELALKVSVAGDAMTGALQLPNIGINTTPDAVNKVAVKSSALLFDNIGNGVQLKANKNVAADTASVLYQTGYSGRAEIGLCGDDNFHFKVSQDGATFYDGLVLDKSSGQATLLTAPNISGMTAGSVPFFGASGLLSQDNANFFWDGTNHRLGLGTATPTAQLETDISGNPGTNFIATRWNNAATAANVLFQRANGTKSAPTVISTNGSIGTFNFAGYDGVSAFRTAAQFRANVIEPTPGPTAMGGTFILAVAPLGTIVPTTVFQCDWSTGLQLFGNVVVDTNRVFRPRSYISAALPAATTTGVIHVSDDGGGATLAYSDGTNWRRVADRQIVGTGSVAGQVAAILGVNATPDATNKLSVASSAILFNNIGSDCRIFLNKAAAGNTASTLYEDGFSGRAEVGLCGDDNFHFKVSPNGSSYTDALILDKTSGQATFANALAFSPPSSVTPANNGQVMFEATSNTSLKVKFKGSDGVVRSATLALS